ncbi:protein-tyrosine phosphatase-like protein [Aspergillus varians]
MDTPALNRIHAIPGLYISDQFSARDPSLLETHRISHILCVTRWEDLLRIGLTTPQIPGTEPEIQCKHVNLDDDPTEDILRHLGEMLDWVRDALIQPHPRPHLNSKSNSNSNSTENAESQPNTEHTGGRVLVHCSQGISRSGAVVVAYIMRSLFIPYADALALARVSRRLITPNVGFEWQLRIWEHCGYEVFDCVVENGSVVLTRKPTYEEFVDEVGNVFDRLDHEEVLRAKMDWLRTVWSRLRVFRGDG